MYVKKYYRRPQRLSSLSKKAKKPPRNTNPTEEWEQEQFFKWVRLNPDKLRDLDMCYGSLNGIRLTSEKLRWKAKKQGNRKGIPDIDLPVMQDVFTGLHIELKRLGESVISPEQKEYCKRLMGQGRCVCVCKGYLQAIEIVKKYYRGII